MTVLQDIAPHLYQNAMSFVPAEPDDPVLAYDAGRIFIRLEGETIVFPTASALNLAAEQLRYLFSVDGRRFYLALETRPWELPLFFWVPTAKLRGMETSWELFAAAAGESLYRWYQSQKFCGRCGGRMLPGTTERSMVCSACGNTVYPKICPAVIVAVTDGDRLVLTRYKNRPFKKYALVAGFNEIGESIEETVHREVLEETGLHVRNLRFYKSQPWVFTDTLLMGFYCELDGSDAITVQEDELAEAGWFRRDEIPEDFSHISLTGEMITQFRQGRQ